MVVREYTEADIPQISAIYYHTVHEINSRDYDREQIQAWAPKIYPEADWLHRFDNYTVYVVEEGETIIGFAEFQYPGHIDCFYVHHDWQGKGVGKLLVNTIEKEALKLKLKRLFVDASITAKPFFLSQGFTTVREQQKKYRDLNFTQYFMEKRL